MAAQHTVSPHPDVAFPGRADHAFPGEGLGLAGVQIHDLSHQTGVRQGLHFFFVRPRVLAQPDEGAKHDQRADQREHIPHQQR